MKNKIINGLPRTSFFKKAVLALALVISSPFWLNVSHSYAANPSIISFQGKVTNADGTNVSGSCPTNYSFDFVLYDDPTLGSPSDGVHDKWHELSKTVAVCNGVFQTNLGSATALPDFNANPNLYLAIKFNGDGAGYMTPRIQLSSVPYAINSDKLGGLAASAFGQLSAANTFTNTNLIQVASATALQVQNGSSKEVLTVDTSGGAVILGKAGTGNVNGKLTFATTTASNYTVSIQGNASATQTYTWTLPAADASGCIQSNGAGVLSISACGGGGTTLQTAYNAGATITTASSTDIAFTLTSGNFTASGAGSVNLTPTGASSFTSGAGLTFTGGANSTWSTSGTGSNLIIRSGATTANTALTIDTNAVSTGSGGLTITSGTSSGAGAASGALNLSTGTTGTGTSGAISIKSGDSSLGGTGAVTIDSGAPYSGGGGAVTIGGTNAGAITVGNTGSATVAVKGKASLSAYQVQNASGLVIENINTATGTANNNLIPNASFEQNIHNWVAKGTPTTGPVWDNTASNALYGSGTMKFSGDAAGDGAQVSFPFSASTSYSVSFWIKASTTGPYTVRVDRQDNGSDVGGCADNATISTTWQKITCTFTTGATINPNTSNIFIKQNAAGTPTFFIDGFSMVQGSTVVDYVAPASGLQIDADYGNITLNAGQDADIQPWLSNSNALPTGRRGATSVTANGFAYFIGGTTANGTTGAPVTTVNYAQIRADGSLASWSAAAQTLPVALYGHSSFVANGYLYVFGGCSDSSATAACTTPVTTVYYSKLNSDGTLGAWQTNSQTLPAARGYGSAVFSNGYVYYLGGYNSTAQTTVYSAKLSGDGSVVNWTTTGVTALGTGRYGFTSMNVNGKIYSIGGCSDAGAICNTAITTVEYATPANDGTLGSWTAATSLPTATGFHTTTVLNGYLFNLGGRQASSVVNSVVYAKVNSVGPLGIWQTSANPLPVNTSGVVGRQQATSIYVNSYIYVMGGVDNSSAVATSQFYASGSRVSIFGGLDLLGLSGQTLTDYAGGGTLTAGSTRVVGDLRIDGFADLNNGLSVDSVINLNAISAAPGQNIFNINNLNSNSIFSVRHMSTNFGSLATAGAFVQKNSYWGEEFNNSHLTACNTTAGVSAGTVNSYARGDYGNAASATACTFAGVSIAGGELNEAHVLGVNTTAANQCQYASQNAANGIERQTAIITTATASSKTACALNLAGNATTSNKILTTTNLPVMTFKLKVSTFTAQATGSVFIIGANIRDNPGTDGAGVNLPNTGVFFTNCSTYTAGAPSGCSNTTWYGMVANANALATGGAQTCSVGSGSITAQFSYLRIEVRGTSDIHFYADYNTSDGINESECGTGVTGASSTSAMTPWIETKAIVTSGALTNALDIDYIRSWQDDNVPPPSDSQATMPDGSPVLSAAPLTTDSVSPDTTQPNSFFDIASATSNDAVFEHDVYVHGTLFADKIKANQIEGLQIFTDQIASLQAQLAKEKAGTSDASPTTAAATKETGVTSPDTSAINNGSFVNLVALAQIESQGGLVVAKDAQFNGKTIFALLAQFNGDAEFNGQVTFNNDHGGIAVVHKGDKKVSVKFSKAYPQVPVVVANWYFSDKPDGSDSAEAQHQRLSDSGYTFFISNITINGFDVVLNKSASEDWTLNWLATSVKDAVLSQSTNTAN